MTLIPWQNGKCVAWDVTVADTFATSYIQQTVTSAGAGAERAALNKHAKYDHFKNSYIFIPLACEVIGAGSADSIAFLNELADKIRSITGDDRERKQLYQRLSIAIQRGNAACIQCCFIDSCFDVDTLA